MVNGALHMVAHAGDLTLQRGDPRFELGDRQRIQILFDQERDRFAGARQILVGIHARNR